DGRRLLTCSTECLRGKRAGGMGSPRSEPGRDLLSALPDEVLHHVLSFLLAQEAVRTCVLAQRWRHLWRFATGLQISCGFENEPASVKELREFVDHLLLLRGGSPLSTCELTFSNLDVGDMPRIKLWIRHLLMCKVQNLRLNFDFYASPVEVDRLVSQHLNRLQLSDVKFNDNFLDFSGCPALEVLEIDSCEFKYGNRMLSKSLKYLTISRWTYFSMVSRVRIYTPNLHSLQLEVGNYRAPVLERMPSLVEAVLKVNDPSVKKKVNDPDYDNCDIADSGDCEDEDCFDCYGVEDDTNCVLLQGLSQARSLALISHIGIGLEMLPCISQPEESDTQRILGPKSKVKIKGSPDPTKRSTAISEHLKTVELKCEVLDDRVQNALNFIPKKRLETQ
ncbi:hypothetical protein EJB05_36997, partial [Eragrostis curvula]